MAQIARMIASHNNGVLAVMSPEDVALLQQSASIEEATRKGARWYVFITTERAMRTPELAKLVTGTTEMWCGIAKFASITEGSHHVPLSNGPRYWESEAAARGQSIGTWKELVAHLATKREG